MEKPYKTIKKTYIKPYITVENQAKTHIKPKKNQEKPYKTITNHIEKPYKNQCKTT